MFFVSLSLVLMFVSLSLSLSFNLSSLLLVRSSIVGITVFGRPKIQRIVRPLVPGTLFLGSSLRTRVVRSNERKRCISSCSETFSPFWSSISTASSFSFFFFLFCAPDICFPIISRVFVSSFSSRNLKAVFSFFLKQIWGERMNVFDSSLDRLSVVCCVRH